MKRTKYGHFSRDGREFVITEPRLDRPWMNVLSNGRWCFLASQVGGGYSFLDNPTVGRITRWHIDGVPRDSVGKLVYLRDEKSGEWWTANGYPPTRKLDKWECRVGLGYNRITAEQSGIGSELLFFTPMPGPNEEADPCLICKVTIENRSSRKRAISATNYVELAIGNWYEDTSWREFYLLFNRQDYKRGVIYTRSLQWIKYIGGWQACNSDANNIPYDHAVFLASSARTAGYEGERYEFTGSYRDLSNPRVMDKKACLRNKVGEGRDACSALRHEFELKPGEKTEYVFVLGVCDRETLDSSKLTRKYLTPGKADKAFARNREYWDGVFRTPVIKTPDSDLDMMVNYWFKYQGANLAWWNRNTGYCYSGIYNFGVRDACQDAVSRLASNPDWVRDLIVNRIMIWQFDEGDYAHGGNFVNMFGTRTFHSDDPMNPLFILGNYVRETGDFGILNEKTPWVDPESGISGESKKPDAAVYEHAIAGIEFFWRNFSKRGLPLILKADWNDALDQMGNRRKGESVMLAGWAIICIEMFYTCMEHMGDKKRLASYKKRIARLKDTVNKLCWDGDWYWRGTHDSGWTLGTKKQLKTGGALFTNQNAFAVVAGLADKKRGDRIFSSFEKYLDTPYGSRCFYPPFPEPEPRAGIISRFAPGTKENGSLQGHNSRWRIWAECAGGRGDKAYEILKKMLPCTRHEENPATYAIEPYIACQFIYAPEADRPGEGSHAWATGTACWTLINVWEHMLGIRPETDGLRIDPCLPSDWTECSMIRDYRGATYEIEIRKKKGICKGAVKVTVDGKTLDQPLIEPRAGGGTHRVVVTID